MVDMAMVLVRLMVGPVLVLGAVQRRLGPEDSLWRSGAEWVCVLTQHNGPFFFMPQQTPGGKGRNLYIARRFDKRGSGIDPRRIAMAFPFRWHFRIPR
jgi:hypothetical protein